MIHSHRSCPRRHGLMHKPLHLSAA